MWGSLNVPIQVGDCALRSEITRTCCCKLGPLSCWLLIVQTLSFQLVALIKILQGPASCSLSLKLLLLRARAMDIFPLSMSGSASAMLLAMGMTPVLWLGSDT